ncbi:aconitase X catalytic domain-containing protein [Desulfurococcaceae archaeon MEX13E-LK6-19]|nr:aconitase X catalytic domain-containing protein [Desulfurococcaceae archaeon MEX13E-LK6-19]
MFLTKLEEKMLSGEYGEAVALAMKVIVKVGESLGAEKLVKVRHVHVSGVSYSNIGEPGARFIEKLAKLGGRVSVYTTSNPTCIDLYGSTRIFDEKLVMGQKKINSALEKMGISPSYTCIPYLISKPSVSEHLAWGESNAVAMANSVYGARTNREGGPLTLLAAIVGRTSYAGLHLMENRVARTLVEYTAFSKLDDYWGSLLGLYIGDNISDIPFVKGFSEASFLGIKELLASAAATGSHGLIVLDGITPRESYSVDINEKIIVDEKELRNYMDKISTQYDDKGYILAYVGCPHLTLNELNKLANLVNQYTKIKSNVKFLVTIPYMYKGVVDDIVTILRKKGIEVAYGTCPIVSRLREKPDLVITNSGKALFYLKKLHGLEVSLASIEDMVKEVMVK